MFDHSGLAAVVAVFENAVFKRSGFVTAVAVFENVFFDHSGFATAVAVFEILKIKRSPSVGRFWKSLGCLLELFRECGGSLWAALGRLWVIWGHSGGTLGSLWVALGRAWVIWGHSKGTLGIPLYPSIALHKNRPKV